MQNTQLVVSQHFLVKFTNCCSRSFFLQICKFLFQLLFLLHSLEIVNPDHFFLHLQIVVPDQFLQIVICDPFYLFLQIIFTKFANCSSRSFVNKLLFHIIFLKFYKLLFRIIFFTKSNGNISQILQRCYNY